MQVYLQNSLRHCKLAFLFLFGALILLCQTATAQVRNWKEVQVKVEANEQPLQEVLRQLERQVGGRFAYDARELDLDQPITLRFSGSLYEAFVKLSNMASLDFRQSDRHISIRRKRTTLSLAQTRMLSGIVYDSEEKVPLPGVTVLVKDTEKAAVTNLNGEFFIKLVKENIEDTDLVFRYMGMQPKEVRVGNQSNFSVYLQQQTNALQEVIVTSSYTGEKRREEVVGSIAQLTPRELQVDRPIESLDKMLEGMVAGVQVQTTTELNKPVKVNIRGQNSLTSFGASRSTSTQPLYVIDGVPLYEQQSGDQNSRFNKETLLNPLSNINPQDIASISVLKDAAASAIYGANAANGVIIITTKKGISGKTKVNLSYQSGVSDFINQFKYLSGPQYFEVLREMYINSGWSESVATQKAGNSTTDTDWFNLMNRQASFQNAQIAVAGGNDNTTFRLSGGYLNQQASSLGNDLKKGYLSLRMLHNPTEKLELDLKLSPTLTRQNTLNTYGNVLLPPNISAYKADGSFNELATLNIPNPLAVLDQNEDSHENFALNGSIRAKYNFTDALSLQGLLGSNYDTKKQTVYFSALNKTGASRDGWLRIYDRNQQNWIGFLQAMYDKSLAERHSLNFVAGAQVEDEKTKLLYGSGYGFSFERFRELSQARTKDAASSQTAVGTVSYYSQLTYDLDKKYFLNLNVRSDQSSVFGGDRQVAINSSIGLGWILTKEKFLQPTNVLNHLRLRTSYGSTGNSRIGSYAARGLYDFSHPYDGQTGSAPASSAAPNPDLGWERSFKFNFGVDATLINRINVTAEIYRNTTHDLIASISVPLETGYSTISANTGTMRNQGFELTVNSANIETPAFNWESTLNFAINRNKILEFNKGFESLYSHEDEAAVIRVGQSTGAIWGFEWGGVDPETGEEVFFDSAGNRLTAREVNSLPPSAGTILGDRLPIFEGGLINRLSYKKVSLNFNLLYSYGASFMASYTTQADGRNLDHSNQSVNLLDRWQQPGDISSVPKLNNPRNIVHNSSRYLHDLSYIKLSNVSLAYQLPESWVSKVGLQRMGLQLNATNLLYWYNEKSPEGRNGVAELRFRYPEMRTLTGGISIQF